MNQLRDDTREAQAQRAADYMQRHPAGSTLAEVNAASPLGSTATPADDAAVQAAEGASYARPFLDRIAAGMATPGELATLMQFLQSGPMLEGACAVILSALARTMNQGGTL